MTCEPLRSGFLSADGEIILMMDADMTYPSDRILDFINYVSSGNYDFVVGNRYRANNRPSFGLLRLYGGKTLSFLGNTLFGTNIKDWHCGMRAFKRQDILDFRLKSENMELASEIILGFIKNKSRILQIDISYNKRVGSSKLSIIKDGLRHLYLIVSHFVKN
jgi:glycosyltransferase involved in cell wall biosynthesis